MDIKKQTAILSVSELTRSIKSILELQYRFVHIRGEISNLRIPFSGHMYFSLKDATAQIRAVLFKGQQKYLQGELKEGQSVICHGRLSIYEARGEYQIIIDTIDLAGTGNLQLQFEHLKEKLKTEGLFLDQNKKILPPYPEKIAVITSPTGAAVYDFLKIASIRSYWGDILVIPVSVQGKKSAGEISKAIKFICQSADVDVIVLIRGGGSIEDLWSFNEEETARAIHGASIPIVTGIGHETDYTIADMCADLHSHTPTAAAEALLPNRDLLLETLNNYKRTLHVILEESIDEKERAVQNLLRVIGDLDLYLSHFRLKLDYQFSSLMKNFQHILAHVSTRTEKATEKLSNHAPLNKITLQEQKLHHLNKELLSRIEIILERKTQLLGKQAALLDSASPLSTLSRGYSIVSRPLKTGDTEEIVSDAHQVEKGETIHVRLRLGKLECEVLDKEYGS